RGGDRSERPGSGARDLAAGKRKRRSTPAHHGSMDPLAGVRETPGPAGRSGLLRARPGHPPGPHPTILDLVGRARASLEPLRTRAGAARVQLPRSGSTTPHPAAPRHDRTDAPRSGSWRHGRTRSVYVPAHGPVKARPRWGDLRPPRAEASHRSPPLERAAIRCVPRGGAPRAKRLAVTGPAPAAVAARSQVGSQEARARPPG